jgi:hypothetical protein
VRIERTGFRHNPAHTRGMNFIPPQSIGSWRGVKTSLSATPAAPGKKNLASAGPQWDHQTREPIR